MKMSGTGMTVLVDGNNISGDYQTIAIRGGPAVIEQTGVDVFAYERAGGRRDGALDAVTYFNPETAADDPGVSADRSHVVLRALPLTDRLVTVALPVAGEAWNIVGLQGNYDPTAAADGALTCAVMVQANGYGVECAKLLTPGPVTVTGAGNRPSVDFGAGDLDFGLQAHLHVIELDGDDVTITLQQSSDNAVGDAFAAVTGGAFAEVTASHTTERIQTARDQTVERYLRVNVAGTFTSVTFMVTAEVNLTTVEF